MQWLFRLSRFGVEVRELLVPGMLMVAACGGSSAVAPEPPRLRRVGTLTRVVPEGAELLVGMAPQRILHSEWGRALGREILADGWSERLEQRFGIRMERIHELLIATYSNRPLVIARGDIDARQVVRDMGHRMHHVRENSDTPTARRAGFLGTQYYNGAALDDVTVALGALGGEAELSSLLSRAQPHLFRSTGTSKLRASTKSAFAARSWLEAHREAVLWVFRPIPIPFPDGFETSMLMARHKAVIASARIYDREIQLKITVIGEFPRGATENFRELAHSIGTSDLGQFLGMNKHLKTLSIDRKPNAIEVRLSLDLDVLVGAVRALFAKEIETLLEPS